MNSFLAGLGALDWKPVLTALLLPPVPLLALLLAGMVLRAARRPLFGLALIVAALLGLWFAHCRVTGDWIERQWLKPPKAVAPEALPAMRRELAARHGAVVVLGGGVERFAPEYGEPMLAERSLQRLHYGLWLARRLELPVMFSGGVGRAELGGATEAATAARVAERDYGRPLRWQEARSADTRANARLSVPLLASQGVTDIVLVTHAHHMPRAQRAFQEAIEAGGLRIRVFAAPLGNAAANEPAVLGWLPSAEGHRRVRDGLREWLAWHAGA